MAAILNIIISPYLEKPQIVRIARNLICSHFNQLLQTSHEDTSLSSNEVTKTILLNSALVLEVYLLQRSLFYRLFQM